MLGALPSITEISTLLPLSLAHWLYSPSAAVLNLPNVQGIPDRRQDATDVGKP